MVNDGIMGSVSGDMERVISTKDVVHGLRTHEHEHEPHWRWCCHWRCIIME